MRIAAHSERPHQMRLQAVGPPHTPDHGPIRAERRRQRSPAPMGCVRRFLLRGLLDDPLRRHVTLEGLRGASFSIAGGPPAAKRPRQRLTLSGMMPNSVAMSLFILPSAASSTIWAPCINHTGVLGPRDHRTKSLRCGSVNSIQGADFIGSSSFQGMNPAAIG